MTNLAEVLPEEAGVSSGAVLNLLDHLESGITEPHGLLIMRHGKICVKAAWNPYAVGMKHGMQSLTKTYAGTAIGIACHQGIISLDDRLRDIFPGEVPDHDYYEELTVRSLLCMGTGMTSLPGFEGNWIQNFLRHPIENRPNTAFFYNSVGSTMLGAIIRKKTGKTLHEFLTDHLYSQVGIDPDDIGWLRLGDGMEIGGSGLFTTLEANARLMKLYLDNGVCDGRRILPEDYVRMATSKQTVCRDSPSREGSAGYGFQMWMCSRDGCYRADGAMGQYGFVCPAKDTIIILHETLSGEKGDVILSWFYQFLDEMESEETDARQREVLQRRLMCLSLASPFYNRRGNRALFEGSWDITEGRLQIGFMTGGIMQEQFPVIPVDTLSISFEKDRCRLAVTEAGAERVLFAGMEGAYIRNRVLQKGYPVDKMDLACSFLSEDVLILQCRFPETCYAFDIRVRHRAGCLEIEKSYQDSSCNPEPGSSGKAKAERGARPHMNCK